MSDRRGRGVRGFLMTSVAAAVLAGPALAEAFLDLPPGPVRARLTALARAIGALG